MKKKTFLRTVQAFSCSRLNRHISNIIALCYTVSDSPYLIVSTEYILSYIDTYRWWNLDMHILFFSRKSCRWTDSRAWISLKWFQHPHKVDFFLFLSFETSLSFQIRIMTTLSRRIFKYARQDFTNGYMNIILLQCL